jgi:hypothetical protein
MLGMLFSGMTPNGLGIGEVGEFEKRQLGFCTKV